MATEEKRTYIPQKSEKILKRYRNSKPEYKLLPESLLLDYVLEEAAKRDGLLDEVSTGRQFSPVEHSDDETPIFPPESPYIVSRLELSPLDAFHNHLEGEEDLY